MTTRSNTKRDSRTGSRPISGAYSRCTDGAKCRIAAGHHRFRVRSGVPGAVCGAAFNDLLPPAEHRRGPGKCAENPRSRGRVARLRSSALGTEGAHLLWRQYGGSTGKPSEEAIQSDALALFDRVHLEYSDIAVIGRSLGSGVATRLASRRPVSSLV